jgi:hypothetical protein
VAVTAEVGNGRGACGGDKPVECGGVVRSLLLVLPWFHSSPRQLYRIDHQRVSVSEINSESRKVASPFMNVTTAANFAVSWTQRFKCRVQNDENGSDSRISQSDARGR